MTVHSPFPAHGEPDPVDGFLFGTLPCGCISIFILLGVLSILLNVVRACTGGG